MFAPRNCNQLEEVAAGLNKLNVKSKRIWASVETAWETVVASSTFPCLCAPLRPTSVCFAIKNLHLWLQSCSWSLEPPGPHEGTFRGLYTPYSSPGVTCSWWLTGIRGQKASSFHRRQHKVWRIIYLSELSGAAGFRVQDFLGFFPFPFLPPSSLPSFSRSTC